MCESNCLPDIGFIVQNGFLEAAHNRYVERYLKKFASRMGCRYIGTIIKGGGEIVRAMPAQYRKAFDILYQLVQIYGETGHFDSELVRNLAKPEKFSKPVVLIFKVLLKTKPFRSYWNNMLKENGAFEKRFDRPYFLEPEGR